MSRSGEVTEIRTDGLWAHIGAIGYFAVLAYPKREEWPKRNRFMEAAKAWLAKEYIKHGGKRAEIRPHYRQWKNEKIDGVLNRAFYRIKGWRLPAAKLAWEKIMDGQRVGPFVLKVKDPDDPNWKPRSVLALAERGARLLNATRWEHSRSEREFGWDVPTFTHRVWASSKPVLHLALYFPYKNRIKFNPLLLIHDPSWLRPTLLNAEAMRLHLRRWFPTYDPESAIRLLPTEP